MTDRKIHGIEILRGHAALYVFLHHFVQFWMNDSPVRKFFVFGQVAVMLFFLLSGFVISYSTMKEPVRFGPYFVRRFRRIYPAFVLALAWTWLCHCLTAGEIVVPNLTNLAGNLFLLQDYGKPGNWFLPFLGNWPLWSLSYEWFFYMCFYPTKRLVDDRPRAQLLAVLSFSVAGYVTFRLYPNPLSLFASYYVLWWAGAEVCREYVGRGDVTWRGQVPTIGALSLMVLLWGQWLVSSPSATAWEHPGLELRHVATILVLFVVGLVWWRAGAIGFLRLLGWGRLFAPISYALYIFHEPWIELTAKLLPGVHPVVGLLVAAVPVIGVSYLVEQVLQPHVNRLLTIRAPRRAYG